MTRCIDRRSTPRYGAESLDEPLRITLRSGDRLLLKDYSRRGCGLEGTTAVAPGRERSLWVCSQGLERQLVGLVSRCELCAIERDGSARFRVAVEWADNARRTWEGLTGDGHGAPRISGQNGNVLSVGARRF